YLYNIYLDFYSFRISVLIGTIQLEFLLNSINSIIYDVKAWKDKMI
ncbi:MAG: hypothetical protein RLZZ123_1851, partial [Pseudomonadota bacterium]